MNNLNEIVFIHSSMSKGYAITLNAIEEDGMLKFGVNANHTFRIINTENKISKEKIEDWYYNIFRGEFEMSVKVEKLEEIIINDKNITVVENSKEAYTEFLRITSLTWRGVDKNIPEAKWPPRPDRSFELLTDWFLQVLEIERKLFLSKSLDNSASTLVTLEIDLINNLIEGTKKKFNDFQLKNKSPIINFKGSSNILFIANQTFVKWLEARKNSMEQGVEIVKKLSISPKLIWNGQNNILIDAFYQMKHKYNKKNEPLLPNSNEDVAAFLKENFECFKDVKLSTIIGQLKKSERPRKMEKRIKLKNHR